MKSVRTGQPHDHVPCYFTGCKRERIESECSLALLFWPDSVYLGIETEGSLLISMVWIKVWLITAAVRFGGWSMNIVMIIIIISTQTQLISTGNFFTAYTFNIHLRNLSLNLRWTEVHSLTCSDRFQYRSQFFCVCFKSVLTSLFRTRSITFCFTIFLISSSLFILKILRQRD